LLFAFLVFIACVNKLHKRTYVQVLNASCVKSIAINQLRPLFGFFLFLMIDSLFIERKIQSGAIDFRC